MEKKMNWEFVILGCIIFFTSALLQGLSGFGFSLLAIPLITLIISPRISVPILLIYSIIINITVLIMAKRVINLKKIWLLLVGAFLAIPFGTKLLIILPEDIIRIAIGIMILIFGILLLTGYRFKFKRSKIIMLPIGYLSGILSASISIGGPPLIIYFTNQGTEKQEFRSNLAIYFFLLNIVTVPAYFFNGLFTGTVFKYTLIYFPALLTGVVTGSFLSHKMKDHHFRRFTLYLLVIMGLTTLISVFI